MAGRFFDGHSAAAHAVEVSLGADRRVYVKGLPSRYEHPLDAVEISARVGRTPRILRFPDGAACEIADNDAVDSALELLGIHGREYRVHWLESRWKYALGAAVVAVAFVWGAIEYGIPAAARHVANVFPASADRSLGIESLEIMDKTLFTPSQLPAERQAALSARFAAMTQPLSDGHEYRLEFRHGGKIGPNAFALPSGIVVMTDELVELSRADEELLAVLAHEIGHVVQRHSLRMLLQNSVVSLVMMAITGDVSTASVLAASVPTVLVHAKHSRQFEAEADDYAYAWLDRNGIPRRHFGAILQRIEETEEESADAQGWFSTHPRTAERVRN
jgi:Zn-dependent protease with chaperone function